MKLPDPYVYHHNQPRSWQSLAFETGLRLSGLKGYLGRIREKTWRLRQVEQPFPPAFVRRRARVTRQVLNGRNVYWLRPKGTESGHYVLYLHGGAFVINFTPRHWDMMLALVEGTGCTLVAPDYPLIPETSYKERYELILPLYHQLAGRVGAEHITLMGESAGGNMCLSLAQQLKRSGGPLPAQLILLSPWLDVTMTHPEITAADRLDPFLPVAGARYAGRLHAGDREGTDPLISPIYGPLEGLGPIHIFTGTRDILNPDARRLKVLADKAGVPLHFYEYPGMIHAWMIFSLPESRAARRQIMDLLREATQRAITVPQSNPYDQAGY